MKNLRRVLLVAAAAVIGVLAIQNTAFAQEDVPTPVTVDDAGSLYLLSPTWVKVITGLLLPILVGLLTKAEMNKVVKGVIGLVLSAASALVIRWTTLDGSLVFDQAALEDIVMIYGVQIATYLGIYRQGDLNQQSFMLPDKGVG